MKRDKGFSLIEVIISIMILAIGIMALIGAYSTYVKSDTYAKIKTLEFNIARAKLEEALAMPISEIGPIEPEEEETTINSFKFKYSYVVIPRATQISQPAGSKSIIYYKIKVRVHKANDNKEKGVELIAYREE